MNSNGKEDREEMAKKALLWAMAIVFCIFVSLLILGLGEIVSGVNLSIATAVILIGLFVSFIMVSERERKRRNRKS